MDCFTVILHRSHKWKYSSTNKRTFQCCGTKRYCTCTYTVYKVQNPKASIKRTLYIILHNALHEVVLFSIKRFTVDSVSCNTHLLLGYQPLPCRMILKSNLNTKQLIGARNVSSSVRRLTLVLTNIFLYIFSRM